jgi:hypothetical protein
MIFIRLSLNAAPCGSDHITLNDSLINKEVHKIKEPSQNSRCQKGDMQFHIEDPQILGATIQNLVQWQPGTSFCAPLH